MLFVREVWKLLENIAQNSATKYMGESVIIQ